MLLDLIIAANYLNIKSLSNLMHQKFANMITSKSPEEIWKIFKLNNYSVLEVPLK